MRVGDVLFRTELVLYICCLYRLFLPYLACPRHRADVATGKTSWSRRWRGHSTPSSRRRHAIDAKSTPRYATAAHPYYILRRTRFLGKLSTSRASCGASAAASSSSGSCCPCACGSTGGWAGSEPSSWRASASCGRSCATAAGGGAAGERFARGVACSREFGVCCEQRRRASRL